MRIIRSLLSVILLQVLLADAVVAAAKKANLKPLFSTDQRIDSGFVVPVTHEEKSYNFLFDTGASLMVIDRDYADLLSTKPTREQIDELNTAGMSIDDNGYLSARPPMGDMDIQVVLAKSLSFGTLRTMEDFPATVADLSVVDIPDLARLFPMFEIKQFTWVMETAD